MPQPLDPGFLPLIDAALSRAGWMPRLPAGLRAAFYAEGDAARRANNRIVILLLTALFDLFWLPQFHATPDIVVVSGVLRLAVFTPCAIAFCLLDFRGRLGRLYEPALLALALAPCAITAYLCLATTEMLAQPEIYGTPLILLYTGVLLRLRLPTAVVNAAVGTLVYVGSVVACPMLMMSNDQMATVIFIQVVIAVAVVAFNLQLEIRDRRVFLLTQNERIRRMLVVEQNRGLLREAQTDALTSLVNRRCFDETLSARWIDALRAGDSLSLIMIDVDHFKAYNDHYGHVMGDNCLRRVAAAMLTGVRKADVLARYGGEEFAVIMSTGGPQEAAMVAERLREAVADIGLPHEAAGSGGSVTVSIGVATAWPATPHGARKLIEEADANLYAAKRQGRNRVSAGSTLGLKLAG